MLFFNRHGRIRDDLSAYIDGELSVKRAGDVESHLADCDSCRLELEGLHVAATAVRGLPQAEPPRSFVLTPAQVARPAPSPLPSRPPLTAGMRLAAPVLAFALAVVLVADFGSFGNNDGDTPTVGNTLEFRNLDADASSAQEDRAAPAATGVPSPQADQLATTGESAAGADAKCATHDNGPYAPADVGVGATPPPGLAEPTPAPAVESGDEAAICTADGSNAYSSPAPPEYDAVAELQKTISERLARENAANSDGGVSSLRVVEIVLAAALAVVVCASAFRFVSAKLR